MKRTILIFLSLILYISRTSAQDAVTTSMTPMSANLNNLYGLSWEISIPTNNDFLTKTSWAGGRFEYRHFLPAKPVSFGVSLSWNSYEQYIPTQTIYYDNTKAITTDMDRIIYTVPVAATVHYYFNYGKPVLPYIGIGIGAQYSDQSIFYNIFESDEENWGFLVRPEIGVLIRPGQANWGILLSSQYSYATNKNTLFDMDDLKNFSFNIGLFINN